MKNTITFEVNRRGVSSTGNVEWYEFTVTTTQKITTSGAIAIGNAHGVGGQSSSCEETQYNGLFVYLCKSTCYCD